MKLYLLLLSAPLWAAASPEVEEHAASITQLFFPFINFLIFAYLIKRFALPTARDYFRTRRVEILSAVRGAAEEKKLAEEKLRDYHARLTRLATEAREIQQVLGAEAERERAKLLAEAENLAAKIKSDVVFLAEQEVRVARQQIRAEIARLAQQAAQQALERHMTAADEKRLVEEFLGGLGAMK